ncbi:MAG: MATE family efflux transporter, partial [Blautia sp.]|nr:MATE family efflux transporter [Blautia sp.]
FVGLLDNIMIGSVGTTQMSGASIVNQLIFVYNLCLFGAVSGAGIFTAQYFGNKDMEGVRSTFRYKLWICFLITISAVFIFLAKGDSLIQIYLKGEGSATDAAATLEYGRQYLRIMLAGLPPFMLGMVYSSTLREGGKTMLPMKAGITAVFVNLVFNYLLIFGRFGFPQLGVRGAAIATVFSRYVELIIIFVGTHFSKGGEAFTVGLYRTMLIPGRLIRKYFIKGIPLMLNESLWASGIAILAQCYSLRSLDVVPAMNINNTIGNVFNIVFIALGECVAIVVGQYLGAGDMENARDTDNKLIVFSVFCCSIVAIVMFILAPFFPRMYNTTPEIRNLAKSFIMVTAAFLPLHAFVHASYFTLRSGGKTFITFLFDCVYVWVVDVPLAFYLSRYTSLPILSIFMIVQAMEIVKCVIGFVLVKKGIWMQNIVEE